jgi:phosphate starvation-inducible protein PhoH and related proteins
MSKASKRATKNPQHFQLKNIKPLTENQHRAFQEYENNKNLILHGSSGSGKSFIALYLAMREITNDSSYQNVIVVRSAVSSRDQGHLPGNIKEKSKVFEEPYYEICADLYNRGDAYDVLKNKGMIQFITTSHLRGMTFRNAIIIADEIQNFSGGECDTVMTRVGECSRIIFSGDYKQTDLKERERHGFDNFMNIIKRMPSFSFIEFGVNDIVRSGLCKEYLTIKENMGIDFL